MLLGALLATGVFPVAMLVARTAGRTHRPLLNRGNPREILAGLIETRYPVYALADLRVRSDGAASIEDMVDRVLAALADRPDVLERD